MNSMTLRPYVMSLVNLFIKFIILVLHAIISISSTNWIQHERQSKNTLFVKNKLNSWWTWPKKRIKHHQSVQSLIQIQFSLSTWKIWKNKIEKMVQPLLKIQRLLIWLCMHTADESLSVWQKMARILFTLIVFTSNLCTFATCLAYSCEYYSIDVNGTILALTTVVSEIGIIYIMIMTILMNQKIVVNFENLTQIYADSKC